MKKYLFILPLFLFFILPLNVSAMTFGGFNNDTYKNSSLTQYDVYNDYRGERFTSLYVDGTQTQRLYFNWSKPSTVPNIESVDMSFLLHNYNGNFTAYEVLDSYGTGTSFSVYGTGITIAFYLYQSNGSTSLGGGVCRIVGSLSASQNNIYGTINCPVFSNTTKFDNLQIRYMDTGGLTNGNYDLFMGVAAARTFYYEQSANSSSVVESIENQTTSINNSINNVDSTISDSTGNTNSDNANAISGFEQNVASNSTISSLIVMPITLYQKILNSVSGSCATFTLGNLLGTNMSFPCINPANYLGSSLWSIIDVICSGLLIFAISKRFISIFDGFTSMSTTKDEVGD